MRQRSRARTGLAAVAALCAVGSIPGPALAAPGDGPADPASYRTADGAKKVAGTESSADAPPIRSGFYQDSIGPGEKLYYSVTLDATSGAFVSAVALPKPGSSVKYGDGIKVSLQSTDNTECGGNDANFGVGEQARPIAAYATRKIKEGGNCQQAGAYYLVIERTSAATSDPGKWPLEIRSMSEPGLKSTGSTEAPTSWPSASPTPPTGQARARKGGTGFNDAPALDKGVWKDRLQPGRTRFYRVPLDWGQQLSGSLELANSTPTQESHYAPSGLTYELYNPARGRVDNDSMSYNGEQKSVTTGPTAPVAYANRFTTTSDVNAMQVAGWYYLAVTLHDEVGKFTKGGVPLLLRLNIDGAAKPGPPYDGDAAAAGFGLTDRDLEAAEKGQTAAESEKSGTLTVVAAAAFGTGTVLVVGLGVWTVVARRRAAAPAAAGAPYGGGPVRGAGFPQGAALPHPSPAPAQQHTGQSQPGQPQAGRPHGGAPQPGQQYDPRYGQPPGW
ncbi:hypothetical protein [Streptomyces sp. NPDC047108]|uniref:hypothetical protein n=1 Tax=Streptomyces sp. NPDC047108 TaxID=3155025 RepID=UPI003403EF9B